MLVPPEKIRYFAIGVSTGGPQALHRLMSTIKETPGASFLIVQHMPAGYTEHLAKSLNGVSPVTVKEAEDGEAVRENFAYIAPGGYHMCVRRSSHGGLELALSEEKPERGHRPSFDVLLKSFCETGAGGLAVMVLTGMGNDGTVGIRKLRETGESIFVVAQDEESSIVHGMPGAAIRAGVVDLVLPLKEMADKINQIALRGVD